MTRRCGVPCAQDGPHVSRASSSACQRPSGRTAVRATSRGRNTSLTASLTGPVRAGRPERSRPSQRPLLTASIAAFLKTQPLAERKLGFGTRDAFKTSEFTNTVRTEQYREQLKVGQTDVFGACLAPLTLCGRPPRRSRTHRYRTASRRRSSARSRSWRRCALAAGLAPEAPPCSPDSRARAVGGETGHLQDLQLVLRLQVRGRGEGGQGGARHGQRDGRVLRQSAPVVGSSGAFRALYKQPLKRVRPAITRHPLSPQLPAIAAARHSALRVCGGSVRRPSLTDRDHGEAV